MQIKEIIDKVKNNTITEIDVYGKHSDLKEIKDLTNALEHNDSVIRIDASSKYMRTIGAFYFAKMLKTNKSITKLDFGANDIKSLGAQHIADALKTNKSLTAIDLSCNMIEDAGIKSLAQALMENTSITTIHLSGNHISVEGLKDIAKVFESTQSLAELYLRTNRITAEDIQDITQALKVNKSLTILNLDQNFIKNTGAIIIAQMLEVNRSLVTISLDQNKIGDSGAKAIANALEVHSSLTKINLNKNNIGNEGAKDIAKALEINSSLTEINLSMNDIRDEGAKAIAKALEVNQSVIEINLGYNQIAEEGATALAKALETNYRVTKLHFDNNFAGAGDAKRALQNEVEKNQKIKSEIDAAKAFAGDKMYDMAYKTLDAVLAIKADNQHLIHDINLHKVSILADQLCSIGNYNLINIPEISLESVKSQEQFFEHLKSNLTEKGLNKSYTKFISDLKSVNELKSLLPNELVQKIESFVKDAQEKVGLYETDLISFTKGISPVPLLLLASETRMNSNWKNNQDKDKYFTQYKKIYPKAKDLISKLQEDKIDDKERSELVQFIKDNQGSYLEKIDLLYMRNYIPNHEANIENLVEQILPRMAKIKLEQAISQHNLQCKYDEQSEESMKNIAQKSSNNNDDGYDSMDEFSSGNNLITFDNTLDITISGNIAEDLS